MAIDIGRRDHRHRWEVVSTALWRPVVSFMAMVIVMLVRRMARRWSRRTLLFGGDIDDQGFLYRLTIGVQSIKNFRYRLIWVQCPFASAVA